MGLTDYRRKRHFQKTPEPSGVVAKKAGWSYVIQKHDASRLHYDFRLELDGVLKSWAVPKGPCRDPSVKRLAVQVEDHPVSYGSFEGIIPAGEYGGGTVLLWDTGTWKPLGDPNEGYKKGKLKFELHGEKLQGNWMLIRGRSREKTSSPQWLLIKEQDEFARGLAEGDILEESPESIVSGRNLEKIASDRDEVWHSNGSTTSAKKKTASRRKTAAVSAKRADQAKSSKKRGSKQETGQAAPAVLPAAARAAPLPTSPKHQLATLTTDAPAGDQWLHEVKFDGYRMFCRIDHGKVTFLSRNQLDWTKRFNALAEAASQLSVESALLDGELVALRPDGVSDFQSLQNSLQNGGKTPLFFYAFDLLYLNGYSFADCPLVERKSQLERLIGGTDGLIRFSEHVSGRGDDFQRQACRLHLEGMISKRGDRPYQPGRNYDWLKIKCLKEEEFIIGGYTEPSGSRHGFGALLLGYFDEQKRLIYVGKVGTGFNGRTLTELGKRLGSLERKQSPFDASQEVPKDRKTHFVKPELVAQIVYGSRTQDGILRHSSFLGLREDKPAKDVHLDEPVPVEKAVAMSHKTKPATKSQSRPSSAADDSQPGDKGADETYQGVRFTSPDKVLFSEDKYTKLDLAQYYMQVAEWILPHLQHRPLVLVRCPEGEEGECFYQKHPGRGTPENLRQFQVREKRGMKPYVMVDDLEGLISIAQMGALEIHTWGSREDRLESPDRLIFDLDPDPGVPWETVVDSARQMRQFLKDLTLESFLKTTGGKGLHLVVPIDRYDDWETAKEFCHQVAQAVATADPKRYTTNMAKAARTDKIFVDYLRNGRGATAVAPYSSRAKPGAPVAAPISWDELSAEVRSDQWNIKTLPERLSRLKKDPWDGIAQVRQRISGAAKRLKPVMAGA